MARLGDELSAAYPDGVLLVAVLKGSLPFVADLVRQVTVPCEVDFLGISTYTEGTGRVRIVKDLDHDVHDRHVVLVEDIVDTGLTCTYILGELGRRGPGVGRGVHPVRPPGPADRARARCASRASRPPMTCSSATASTWPGRYRNLPFVAAGDPRTLETDPDAYVGALYGR